MIDALTEQHARLYELLATLETGIGGRRRLGDCNGRLEWPERGVYLFFEDAERRSETPASSRVVRVGTHAVSQDSKTTLWKRLSQHRGVERTGGGNHCGSIFRLIVGEALIARDAMAVPSWGSKVQRDQAVEMELELLVSAVLRDMAVVWLPVKDAADKNSRRGYIEKNAIALLSDYHHPALDLPSANWLGNHCPRSKVRASRLWNQNHVQENVDEDFLNIFKQFIASACRQKR